MNNTLIDITKLSDEEKAQYYNDWKESGLKAVQFCTEKRLPFISFRYWCKRYKKKEIQSPKGFSPVSLAPKKLVSPPNDRLLDIGMKLPNHIQLQLTLPVGELLGFVRGLCDATSIIR